MNTSSLRYGWDIDAVVMDYVFRFQWFIEAFVLLFLQSTIFIILRSPSTNMSIDIKRAYMLDQNRTNMSKDIKRAYLLDQLSMICFGWSMSFAIKTYPIYPWPGFFCSGLFCTMFPNIPLWFLMAPPALTMVSVIPFFQYLTFRMYSMIVATSGSRFFVGERAQHILIVICCAMLSVNVLIFGLSVVGDRSEEIFEQYNTPEMLALSARGGRIILLGAPGNPGLFIYEILWLVISIIIILPPIVYMMISAMMTIRTREHLVSSQTHKAEDRLAKVFFYQIISVFIFYLLPLVAFLNLMIVDTTTWPPLLLAIVRPTIIMLLTLKSTVQSMIFLLKNPVYTKKALQKVLHLLRRKTAAENDVTFVKISTAPPN